MTRVSLFFTWIFCLLSPALFGVSAYSGVSADRSAPAPRRIKADIIVYGGTSAGVITAVEAARRNHKVVIVAPEMHLGGLSASGLGFTDTGNKSVIGGLSREFYQRIYHYYQKPETWRWQEQSAYGNVGQGTPAVDGANRTMWIFEPHVAEKVFEDFVREYKIRVYRNQWLDREKGVKMEGNQILSITTIDGSEYGAKQFVDATYEGDLMAAAGVSYHVGREANATYGETWNGIQVGVLHHGHHFGTMKISPYKIPGDPASGILPRISALPPGTKGDADLRVQAYCYRLCLTKNEANRVPFPRPEGYDPSQYELLLRVLEKGWREVFAKFDPIPNLKTDVNNHGPFSMDNIGMNWDYPEASYQRRKEILEEHTTYQQGLLYFLANDPRVPADVQSEMKKWGLSADEFTDNNHWPHQIYVREARRMAGSFVMTENELLGKKPVPQPIGMGSYTIDSHNTQRYITPEGYVQNEGDIGVSAPIYQIDMGAILPRQGECANLLVPVAVSSSHIAFGSIRMEPVFMILGQSAGTMASMALEKRTGLHQLTYDEVRSQLLKGGQILERLAPAAAQK